MQEIQLKIVFKPCTIEKSIEEIVNELVNDTIRKVLTNHTGAGYNYMVITEDKT